MEVFEIEKEEKVTSSHGAAVKMTMALHRWVSRPRILASVAVLSLAYYVLFVGGGPKQWRERFARKGEAIDESLKAVLNETLGVSLWLFRSFNLFLSMRSSSFEVLDGFRSDSIPFLETFQWK